MTRNQLLYYAAVGWTIVLFIGCSLPGNGLPDLSSGRDKWVHVEIFMLFGLLWRLNGRSVWWVLLAGTVYGILIELWQGIMPIGRSCDVYDAVADCVGVVMGIALAWVVTRLSKSVSR